VTSTWITRTRRSQAAAVARLRGRAGLEAALAEESIWLRGPDDADVRAEVIRALPDADHFELLADGSLRPRGRRVPTERLPELTWRPLAEAVGIEPPTALLCGHAPPPVAVRLLRTGAAREPGGLLTDLDRWAEYAACAPRVRLERWRFAACADRRVVVLGTPLPPIAGQRLVVEAGIAVPAGWGWSPPVDAAVLAAAYGVGRDDLVLLTPDGAAEASAAEASAAEVIGADAFARASRSAVRLTVREVPNSA
jgi:hypothetical protein